MINMHFILCSNGGQNQLLWLLRPWSNDQTLFGKQLKFFLASNVWPFYHVTKNCLKSKIPSPAMFEEHFVHSMLVSCKKCLTSNVLWCGQTFCWEANLKCMTLHRLAKALESVSLQLIKCDFWLLWFLLTNKVPLVQPETSIHQTTDYSGLMYP